jgi:hypothetical protein
MSETSASFETAQERLPQDEVSLVLAAVGRDISYRRGNLLIRELFFAADL